MEKRRLGKTGHMSTILTLSGATFIGSTQAEADAAIDLAMEHGINQIDVAPAYGDTELRIGPWMPRYRNEFFLGCKTMERDRAGAWESIKRSLDRLQTDYFDLYQFHSVDDLVMLDTILGPGGAMEAVLEAKQQGIIGYIGITGHRPNVFVEAIKRFDFDTVLFPLNRVLAAQFDETNDFRPLIDMAKRKDIGMIALEPISKRLWPSEDRPFKTMNEPFSDQEGIYRSLAYTLSQGVTTCPLQADERLWPMLIEAAERFTPMTAEEQIAAVEEVKHYHLVSPSS